MTEGGGRESREATRKAESGCGMVGGVEREGEDRAEFGVTVTYYLELRYFL